MRKFRTQSDCGFRMRHFASLLDAIFLTRVMWEEVFKSSLKLRRVVNWLIVNVPMILQVKVVILCSVSHVILLPCTIQMPCSHPTPAGWEGVGRQLLKFYRCLRCPRDTIVLLIRILARSIHSSSA